MKPPYILTDKILQQVATISEKIGAINASHLQRPATELRKKNRIRSIQSSLEIEGNTLTVEQITAIFEKKRVLGPKREILEVQNAIGVYDQLRTFKADSLVSFCKAHGQLMKGLVEKPGKLRTKEVGIVKGKKIAHLAPPGSRVTGLMKNLFDYLKKDQELLLIKSCVFHYELEFIHPFTDGNGRMGRLWQTVILLRQYPVFEFLPVESLIRQKQKQYYAALSSSDKTGQSTPFITFMLGILDEALQEVLETQRAPLSADDRLSQLKDIFGKNPFSRKDYLQHFKHISAPTASRDLAEAVKRKLLKRSGDKRMTKYVVILR